MTADGYPVKSKGVYADVALVLIEVASKVYDFINEANEQKRKQMIQMLQNVQIKSI